MEPTSENPQLEQSPLDEAHYVDNQRRMLSLETAMEANSRVTEKTAAGLDSLKVDVEKLRVDTSALVEMWTDAGVVFKWLRRIGASIVTLSKWVAAAAALYMAWRYGTEGKP